jgi:hypothetical protein
VPADHGCGWLRLQDEATAVLLEGEPKLGFYITRKLS